VAGASEAGQCGLLTGCFRADARLQTSEGWRRVDEIRAGERVAARNEADPDGAIEWKPVEAKFERTGRILELVANGQEIGTTPEHPFYVRGKGWAEAGALHAGDEVRTQDGWVEIEEVRDTGLYEKVYNIRVADFHTYFVGGDGFAVWAHNANPLCEGTAAINESAITQTILRDNRPYQISYQGVGSNSQYGPRVYRVLSISGPITLSARGSDAKGATAQFQSYLGQYINAAVPPNNYNAGHLIGASLGGPNDTRNLVPQQGPTNQYNAYAEMEGWLRDVLGGEVAQGPGQQPSAPTSASMMVTLSYPSITAPGLTRFIPNKFTVQVTLDGQVLTFTFNQNSRSFTAPGATEAVPLGYW
jgi:Pretoxin HINT domain/DNA/RNA non-specific endonuclease